MSEQSELDFTGDQLKAKGMKNVFNRTPDTDSELFIETIKILVANHPFTWFSSDVITDIIGFPESRNAIGALMNKAAKMGLIEPYGFTKGTRPSQHGHMIRTWVGKK